MSSVILIDPHNTTEPLPPHPDHLTLEPNEAGTAIGIDTVRDLIRWAHHKPFARNSKRILIRQAQHLTEEAQNALLKVLEEPPPNTKITLTVDHPENLLETVRSRCAVEHVGVDRRVDPNNGMENTTEDTGGHIGPPLRLPTDVAEAFTAANELAQLDRHAVIEELDELILKLRGDPTPRSLGEGGLTSNWQRIKKIRLCQKQIRDNVNVRLAVENLFLSII